jgi:enoyl-CoA hydratase/carnithine racemase
VTADTKAPGWTDLVGKAKFAAWKSLGDLPQEEAMKQYSAYIAELAGPEGDQAAGNEPVAASAAKPRDTLESIAQPRGTANIADLALKTIKTSLSVAGVLTVTLNRPARGNAFNVDMWNDLREVFEAINLDAAVRVVVLTGNEKAFSTGMDLGVFQDMDKLSKQQPCPGRLRESLGHIIQWLQDAISGPERCSVPVIAAINGYCIGGAVDLVTACDLRYCTDDAVFSIKETGLAMVADIGTLQRLPKLIGDMQARELAYTGRNFTGQEAQQLGLVLKSFATHADMQEAVAATAASIAEKSPLTVRGIKTTALYTRDNRYVYVSVCE